MERYEVDLRKAGLDSFLEKLGLSFEETMLAPARGRESNPYEGYRWLLLANRLPAIAHGQVAFALPPADKMEELPWEEWFIMDGAHYHQVFYAFPHPSCNAQWTAPDVDDQHPDQILGRGWHYYIDKDQRPALLQK